MKGIFANCLSVKKLLKEGRELKLATKNYPSRGQTSIQKLYQTKVGKLFYKQVSERNHRECQINVKSGTLAEREYWAFLLAKELKLEVPELMLLDELATIQVWLNFSDAKQYSTSQGAMELQGENIFNCALFDWLTGQIDRHDANYLYDMVNKKIILIDSGYALLKYDGDMPDYLRLYEIAYSKVLETKYKTEVLNIIRKMGSKRLRTLVPLRDTIEFNSLLNRLERLDGINTIQGIIDLYRGRR